MKSFSKYSLIVLAGLALPLALVGCNKTDTTGTDTSTPPPASPATTSAPADTNAAPATTAPSTDTNAAPAPADSTMAPSTNATPATTAPSTNSTQ